jgi:DNA invertase Pin-like site-specific DNA recombinase
MRISQDRRGEGWAIGTQRRKIRQMAKDRGWQIVAEYEDSSVSASKPRGAGTDWARMLRDADRGDFTHVVAVDVDRLLRSTKDLISLVDRGLRVATVDGEIDLASADGEFRATMLAGIARFEAQRKAERTIRSNERRRAEGMPVLSGWTPFGYTKDGQQIEEQAEAIRAAFDAFTRSEPKSIKRLAEDLNKQGFVTSRGKPWSTYAARYLLGNPIYAGFIRYSKTGELYPVAEGEKWQPIVEEAIWRRATARLEHNQSKVDRRGNQPRYLLSGVARCGRCGAAMVAGQNERRVPTYRCGSKSHLSRQRELVDAMVDEAMVGMLARPDIVDLLEPAGGTSKAERQALMARRRDLEARLADLGPMLRDTSVSMDMIRSSMKALEEEISEIDEKLVVPTPSQARRLAERVSGVGHVQARLDLVRRLWDELDIADRRMIVGELVTVTIQPIVPGHTRFNPDLIEIEPRWG